MFAPDASSHSLDTEPSLRQQALDGPLELLALSDIARRHLTAMGFATVREAFRAALAGRLASRKQGGEKLEAEVLAAGCALLGHPPIDRTMYDDYRPPASCRTVGDALAVLNGGPFTPSRTTASRSIRDILFPNPLHRPLERLGFATVGDLLATPLDRLTGRGGIGTRSLGSFLLHTFDYLFVLNEPAAGLSDLTPPAAAPAAGPPLGTRLLLTGSFTATTLDRGYRHIEEKRIAALLFQGQAAGAVFAGPDREGITWIVFEQAAARNGFRIELCGCELCGCDTPAERCPHAAAIVLKLLIDLKGRQYPLPLVFDATPWYLLGQILYEVHGPELPAAATLLPNSNGWLLEVPGGGLRCRLPSTVVAEGGALFGNRLGDATAADAGGPIRALADRLHQVLKHRGGDDPLATAWLLDRQRFESFWLWLAAKMALMVPAAELRLEGPGDDGLFRLTAPGAKGPALSCPLPRAKTAEILDCLVALGLADRPEEAQAYSRIAMAQDQGQLIIESWLRLPDGSSINRGLAPLLRYGHYHYLAGRGFLAIREQPREAILTNGRNQATRVPTNRVPEFVEQHRQALLAPENEVESAVIRLQVREMPEELTIDEWRLDDDWCYLSGRYGLGSVEVSLAELLAARRQGQRFLPMGERWLNLESGPLAWLHDLAPERIWKKGKRQGIRLTRRELLLLSGLLPELRAPAATPADDPLRRLLDTDGWQDDGQLPLVPAHLRTYQRHGLAWLHHLYRHRLGGVLADDMGLGKTHQALALIAAIVADSDQHRRFVVVCPTTVVAHWAEKIECYYPGLDYAVYHGVNRDLASACRHTVLITTYGIVRRDIKLLRELDVEVVILDEIQHLKNKRTDVHRAAGALSGRVVIGLTGTPLENSVHDLKAIFDLCLPGFLGSDADYRKRYAVPIEEHNDKRRRESLARLLHPFLLRRTRAQVLAELPEVIEDLRSCELSGDQVTLYREIIEGRGRNLLARLGESDRSERLPYLEVLAVINYLKMICDHPALLADPTDFRRYRSGKWDLFVELLDECLAAGMKVVVFSHYTRMLDIIEAHLGDNDIPCCGLRGSMPLARRQQMIHRFNTDPGCRVFCASLLAGGIGVDLTAAEAVIHYDRWWNAAREDQATARVHRMGQKNVVQVFKLITAGTLEEKIDRLIAKKRDLAHHLVREDDAAVIKRLDRDDLIDLLKWHAPAASRAD